MTSHQTCLETVEGVFEDWVNELIRSFGDQQVKDILGSASLTSIFVADVSQALMSRE